MPSIREQAQEVYPGGLQEKQILCLSVEKQVSSWCWETRPECTQVPHLTQWPGSEAPMSKGLRPKFSEFRPVTK